MSNSTNGRANVPKIGDKINDNLNSPEHKRLRFTHGNHNASLEKDLSAALNSSRTSFSNIESGSKRDSSEEKIPNKTRKYDLPKIFRLQNSTIASDKDATFRANLSNLLHSSQQSDTEGDDKTSSSSPVEKMDTTSNENVQPKKFCFRDVKFHNNTVFKNDISALFHLSQQSGIDTENSDKSTSNVSVKTNPVDEKGDAGQTKKFFFQKTKNHNDDALKADISALFHNSQQSETDKSLSDVSEKINAADESQSKKFSFQRTKGHNNDVFKEDLSALFHISQQSESDNGNADKSLLEGSEKINLVDDAVSKNESHLGSSKKFRFPAKVQKNDALEKDISAIFHLSQQSNVTIDTEDGNKSSPDVSMKINPVNDTMDSCTSDHLNSECDETKTNTNDTLKRNRSPSLHTSHSNYSIGESSNVNVLNTTNQSLEKSIQNESSAAFHEIQQSKLEIGNNELTRSDDIDSKHASLFDRSVHECSEESDVNEVTPTNQSLEKSVQNESLEAFHEIQQSKLEIRNNEPTRIDDINSKHTSQFDRSVHECSEESDVNEVTPTNQLLEKSVQNEMSEAFHEDQQTTQEVVNSEDTYSDVIKSKDISQSDCGVEESPKESAVNELNPESQLLEKSVQNEIFAHKENVLNRHFPINPTHNDSLRADVSAAFHDSRHSVSGIAKNDGAVDANSKNIKSAKSILTSRIPVKQTHNESLRANISVALHESQQCASQSETDKDGEMIRICFNAPSSSGDTRAVAEICNALHISGSVALVEEREHNGEIRSSRHTLEIPPTHNASLEKEISAVFQVTDNDTETKRFPRQTLEIQPRHNASLVNGLSALLQKSDNNGTPRSRQNMDISTNDSGSGSISITFQNNTYTLSPHHTTFFKDEKAPLLPASTVLRDSIAAMRLTMRSTNATKLLSDDTITDTNLMKSISASSTRIGENIDETTTQSASQTINESSNMDITCSGEVSVQKSLVDITEEDESQEVNDTTEHAQSQTIVEDDVSSTTDNGDKTENRLSNTFTCSSTSQTHESKMDLVVDEQDEPMEITMNCTKTSSALVSSSLGKVTNGDEKTKSEILKDSSANNKSVTLTSVSKTSTVKNITLHQSVANFEEIGNSNLSNSELNVSRFPQRIVAEVPDCLHQPNDMNETQRTIQFCDHAYNAKLTDTLENATDNLSKTSGIERSFETELPSLHESFNAQANTLQKRMMESTEPIIVDPSTGVVGKIELPPTKCASNSDAGEKVKTNEERSLVEVEKSKNELLARDESAFADKSSTSLSANVNLKQTPPPKVSGDTLSANKNTSHDGGFIVNRESIERLIEEVDETLPNSTYVGHSSINNVGEASVDFSKCPETVKEVESVGETNKNVSVVSKFDGSNVNRTTEQKISSPEMESKLPVTDSDRLNEPSMETERVPDQLNKTDIANVQMDTSVCSTLEVDKTLHLNFDTPANKNNTTTVASKSNDSDNIIVDDIKNEPTNSDQLNETDIANDRMDVSVCSTLEINETLHLTFDTPANKNNTTTVASKSNNDSDNITVDNENESMNNGTESTATHKFDDDNTMMDITESEPLSSGVHDVTSFDDVQMEVCIEEGEDEVSDPSQESQISNECKGNETENQSSIVSKKSTNNYSSSTNNLGEDDKHASLSIDENAAGTINDVSKLQNQVTFVVEVNVTGNQVAMNKTYVKEVDNTHVEVDLDLKTVNNSGPKDANLTIVKNEVGSSESRITRSMSRNSKSLNVPSADANIEPKRSNKRRSSTKTTTEKSELSNEKILNPSNNSKRSTRHSSNVESSVALSPSKQFTRSMSKRSDFSVGANGEIDASSDFKNTTKYSSSETDSQSVVSSSTQEESEATSNKSEKSAEVIHPSKPTQYNDLDMEVSNNISNTYFGSISNNDTFTNTDNINVTIRAEKNMDTSVDVDAVVNESNAADEHSALPSAVDDSFENSRIGENHLSKLELFERTLDDVLQLHIENQERDASPESVSMHGEHGMDHDATDARKSFPKPKSSLRIRNVNVTAAGSSRNTRSSTQSNAVSFHPDVMDHTQDNVRSQSNITDGYSNSTQSTTCFGELLNFSVDDDDENDHKEEDNPFAIPVGRAKKALKKKREYDDDDDFAPIKTVFPDYGQFVHKVFYDYCIEKMKPKYGIRTNKKVVKLGKYIADAVDLVINSKNTEVYFPKVREMKRVLARHGVVRTHWEFCSLCLDRFTPYFYKKAVPMKLGKGEPCLFEPFDYNNYFLPILEDEDGDDEEEM